MVTLYADNTRPDNTGDGLTLATAKKTIAAVYTLALAQTEAVTILLANGNYMEAGTGLVLTSPTYPIIMESIGGTPTSVQVYPTTDASPTALTFAAGFTGTITFRNMKFAMRNTPVTTPATVIVPTCSVGANITFESCAGVVAGTQQAVYSVAADFAGTLAFNTPAITAALAAPYALITLFGAIGQTAGNITITGGSLTNTLTGPLVWAQRSGVVIDGIAVSTTGNVPIHVGEVDATVPTFYTDDVIVRGVSSYSTAASAHGILLGGGSRRPLVERCVTINTGATAYGIVDKSIDGIVQDCVFIGPAGAGGCYLWKGAQNSTVRRCVISVGSTGLALRTAKGARIGGAGQDQDAVDGISLQDCIISAVGTGVLYAFVATTYGDYAATGCVFSGATGGVNAPDQSTWPLVTNAYAAAGLPTLADTLARVIRPAVSKAEQLAADIAADPRQLGNPGVH
jgi:hypothetical protein